MTKERHIKQVDMLHGPLLKKLVAFALPLAASSILQQLFNSADVAVVGRFAGSQAMAAVGGNSSVISLLINLFVGLSLGANVVIARYIGQGERAKAGEAVHTVMTLAVISGFFLLGLGMFIARPLLLLMDTPLDVIDLAVRYLRIYFIGMPFLMIYNFGSAVLRSVGDTRRPLYCLFIAGVINVGLNLLLVVVFKMSVAGVAIATVISNGVSAGMVLGFLLREDELIRLTLRRLGLKKEHLLRVLRIGVPAGVQGLVFSLSNVVIQTAVNGFGSDAIAGSSAAVYFEFFTYFVTNAFAQTAVTFISQNFGAGQYDRCRKIFRMSMVCSLIITGIMSAAFILGREFFIRFYTTDDPVIAFGLIRMLHVELFACLICSYEISAAAMRGMGRSLLPSVITVIGSCALRLVWVYTVFRRVSTFEMLMNVYPASWIVTGAFMLLAYYIISRRLLRPDSPLQTDKAAG